MTPDQKRRVEPDDIGAWRFWRWLRILGLGLAIFVLIAFSLGYLMGHLDSGGGFGTAAVLSLGAMAVAILGGAWLMWRELRAPTGEEPLTPKERLNLNMLIASGFLGVTIALVMILADPGLKDGGGVFSNDPLPPVVAALLIVILGVLVPILSLYWHKATDEQEVDAYKTGALFGIYVYWIGSAVWWLAWRGGFAPEPNGFVIYFATIFTVGPIWLWKKYR